MKKHMFLGFISICGITMHLLNSTATAQAPPDPADRPNIVFVMTDDARFDEFRPTGAPDWFVAPNIERIANEGANFTRTYASTPICGPSRASIYTGLYSHQTGTTNNGERFYDSLATIQEILHDQGYYTGFIGKYGNGFPSPVEFDYWVDIGDEEKYKSVWIKVNGVNVFVSGHITNAFNDYIDAFFDSVQVHSDKPFVLFFFPLAPHTPNTPRSTDAGLYMAEVAPFPENFYEYPSLYPDFYREAGSVWEKDTAATNKFIKDRFKCLIGVDDNMSHIFNYLDANGQTDSTFMLFTSDNGYINGEHRMRAKALPLDESIHVPLFVRYPTWFPEPVVIDNEILELIDIPKTLLNVAGIEDTFNFVGHSIKDLAEPDTMRHYAFYIYEGSLPTAVFDVPDLRGVRGFNEAFYYSNCDCFTEEYYDFNADPQQNQNQILNPDYYQKVIEYRQILDSMRLSYNDTMPLLMTVCKLVGAFEVPDEIDNDCDGITDDSLFAFVRYLDADMDGFGDADSSIIVFGELAGYVNNNLDCIDTLNSINPASAEICDGIDNDCDGLIDDGDPDIIGQQIWYADFDFDGHGDAATATLLCFAPLNYILLNGDCNDADSLITIGGTEICNLLDDDCDGLTDDNDPDVIGQTIYYRDFDGDGYGDLTTSISICVLPIGYTLDQTDCNDLNININPLAAEVCDGVDNNCDGLIDDADPLVIGMTDWFIDADLDGFGSADSMFTSCFLPFGFADNTDDCNDASALINPTKLDICDLIDNDCDLLIDENIVVPIMTPATSLIFCTGGQVQFSATPIISGFTYKWYKNGVLIPGATAATYTSTATGSYKVEYRAPAGCITQSLVASVTVNKNPKPTVSNTSLSNDLCLNNPVKLSTKSKVGQTYQWFKGASILTGTTTNKYNAVTTGNYKVQVIDINGCAGTSKTFAVVQNCLDIEAVQENGNGNLYLFPNPTDNVFTISMDGLVNQSGVAEIRLFSIIGESVYMVDLSFTDSYFEHEINLNNPLASGVYIVEVVINNTRFYNRLIIE